MIDDKRRAWAFTRVSSLGVKITPPPRRLPWTYPPAYLGLGVLAKYAVSEKLPSG
jgi:hypothetical protein